MIPKQWQRKQRTSHHRIHEKSLNEKEIQWTFLTACSHTIHGQPVNYTTHLQAITDELLDREFQIDHNSLRETFIHMINNLEVWTNLLYERPMQEGTGISIDQLSECPSLASREFSKLAYKISHEGRFDDSLLDTLDKPPYLKTYGVTIGHAITHNMHIVRIVCF